MTSVVSKNASAEQGSPPVPPSRWGRIARAVCEEFGGYDGRRWMMNMLPRLLPLGSGGRMRAAVYRLVGLKLGRGSLVAGPITFGPGRAHRVTIGQRCFLNGHVYMDPAAPITLGDGVSVGHHVLLITSDHAVGCAEFRAGTLRPKPICIEDGVWIAARVTVLPGVTIGRGAVVAAGAVVTRDVPPNTLVGGVPARVMRLLE